MDKQTLTIWGREFELEINYECHSDEEIAPNQYEAFEHFVSNPEWIDKAKPLVEEYSKEKLLSDETNTKKDNIFSYVIPEYVFVRRDSEHPLVALMCKYRYEPEHGMAIVFSDDGKIEIGIQDIIL